MKVQSENNVNDFGGYTPKNLYVKRKYINFKHEILQHFTIKQYNELIINKAIEYMTTQNVKSLETLRTGFQTLYVPWDIPPGMPASIDHIISIILYCDMSEYSKNFSESFRKMCAHETFQSVKKRNQEYWWQSKLLKELVEFYGLRRYDKETEPNGENGPFYTGVSCVLPIPEFSLRLYSPTSTSKHIEVATIFADQSGMIITLNNDTAMTKARFFDCSWISRYAEEDERLFVNGFYSLRVQSVRIIETNENHRKLFQSLFFFDTILNGRNIFISTRENRKHSAQYAYNLTTIEELLTNKGLLLPYKMNSLTKEQKSAYEQLILVTQMMKRCVRS